MKNRFFVITGPSGAGKSTIIKYIKDEFKLEFSISHTTRKPRETEENGREYYFIEEKEFLDMINKNEFFEWAIVHGNYYGTSKKEIERLAKLKKDVVFDLDVQGAMSMKKLYPESIVIFVSPSKLSSIKSRLEKRGEKEIEKRVKNALKEVKEVIKFDYLVINDTLESAIEDTKAILRAEKLKIKKELIDKFLKKFEQE